MQLRVERERARETKRKSSDGGCECAAENGSKEKTHIYISYEMKLAMKSVIGALHAIQPFVSHHRQVSRWWMEKLFAINNQK